MISPSSFRKQARDRLRSEVDEMETCMTLTKSLVFGIMLLLGIAAVAQEYPKAELALDYSYMHFAPSQAYTQNKSLNGGGGAFVWNFTNHIGVKMDLQGYGSFTNTFNIPASTPGLPSGAHGSVSGNLFTYLFGPQLKFRHQRYEILTDTLIGAAHSNVYGSAFKTICQPIANGCGTTGAPSNNGWAVLLGGGLDIPINHTVSVRPAQFDYLLTRFGNFFTKANANQNSFRYSAGVVFNFGHPQ